MRLKRIADLVIYLASLAFVIYGLMLLVVLPFLGTELSRYVTAELHPCSVAQALQTDTCAAFVGAKVEEISYTKTGLDHNTPAVTVTWPGEPSPLLLYVARPTIAYYDMHHGDTVQMTIWNSRPTALHAGPAALRLYANPYDDDELRTVAGVSLFGLGLILIAVHPPLWLRRKVPRATRPDSERRWALGTGLAKRVAHDAQLRFALGVFIVAQLLDVATSIKGDRVGLFEGNPLAAALFQHIGAVIGFILIKLVAVIAILLVMARLPRRPALIVAWVTSAVFAYIALHNVGLILSKLPA